MSGGRFPGGGRLAGELGPKPDGGDGQGGGGGRAARLEDRAAHSRAKSAARARISFQDKRMIYRCPVVEVSARPCA